MRRESLTNHDEQRIMDATKEHAFQKEEPVRFPANKLFDIDFWPDYKEAVQKKSSKACA